MNKYSQYINNQRVVLADTIGTCTYNNTELLRDEEIFTIHNNHRLVLAYTIGTCSYSNTTELIAKR